MTLVDASNKTWLTLFDLILVIIHWCVCVCARACVCMLVLCSPKLLFSIAIKNYIEKLYWGCVRFILAAINNRIHRFCFFISLALVSDGLVFIWCPRPNVSSAGMKCSSKLHGSLPFSVSLDVLFSFFSFYYSLSRTHSPLLLFATKSTMYRLNVSLTLFYPKESSAKKMFFLSHWLHFRIEKIELTKALKHG